jgi:hypothetical protein
MSVHGEAGFWNLAAAAEETAWPPSPANSDFPRLMTGLNATQEQKP